MRAADLLGKRNSAALQITLDPIRPENAAVRVLPRCLAAIWPTWVDAMTTPWGIYLRRAPELWEPDSLERLLVHEMVHLRQWKTLGIVGFLRVYMSDYLRGRIRLLGHRAAYRSISLEAEAYREAAEIQ